MASPRETSLGNLVYERAKGVMAQDKSVLSQITAKDEIVKEIFHWRGTCLRDKTNKARKCAAVVSTSKH
jgi:hypothetical protein